MSKAARHERLQAAADFAGERKREGANAATIIAELIAQHGATLKRHPRANTLRVAGTAASCTWSEDEGLLDAWTKLAFIHLMQLSGRCGTERERVS
jgi:hypothetical protein